MTNEQYERLFSIALEADSYQVTRSKAGRDKLQLDESLSVRELVRLEYDEGAKRHYVYITSFGLLRLHQRLGSTDI